MAYRIYRANKGNGAASEWQIALKKENGYDKYMIFLKLAKEGKANENGDATFDWTNGITVKLGENDIGEMLAFIDGRQDYLGFGGKGLFHKTEKATKIINMTLNDKGGFYLKVSSQEVGGQAISISHSISMGESAVLSTLLKRAIEKIYGW